MASSSDEIEFIKTKFDFPSDEVEYIYFKKPKEQIMIMLIMICILFSHNIASALLISCRIS